MESLTDSSNCRFCGIGRGHTFFGLADQPIDAAHDYFAIASIGAIVEGWTLVLPKRHCLSLRDCYGLRPFSSFSRRTVERVESAYGHVVIFEHGANHHGSLTSCGTDHGHLHVVPLRFSLKEAVGRSAIGDWTPVRASSIQDRVGLSEYLFFSETPNDVDPSGYLCVLGTSVSQFFRRTIADELDASAVADYRQHPFLAAAERTRERLVAVS